MIRYLKYPSKMVGARFTSGFGECSCVFLWNEMRGYTVVATLTHHGSYSLVLALLEPYSLAILVVVGPATATLGFQVGLYWGAA